MMHTKKSHEFRPSVALLGKNILLSGTTGFLGKVVLSLLMSRYPKTGKIFVLIRPGVRETARDRFNKTVITSAAMQPVFEAHGTKAEDFIAQQVVPIDGNIVKEHCGLSEETRATLAAQGIDLIINSAGLVDFDPPVDQAVGINAIGIRHVIQLARELNAGLVHVSTAYVAGKRNGQIREDDPLLNQIPTPDVVGGEEFNHVTEIDRLIELAAEVRRSANDSVQRALFRANAKRMLEEEGRDPHNARAMKSAMLRQRKIWLHQELRRMGMDRAQFWGWTNTYTFTKHLGEQLIAQAAGEGLRASIVRPSIVESALSFPFAGWNEGFTTTAPLVMLNRTGLPHFPYKKDLILDVIPVDMVAGLIVAVAGALCAGRNKLVYQAATGDTNPLTMQHAIELTGLAARQWSRKHGGQSLRDKWLRHQEMRPMVPEKFRRFSVPMFSRVAGYIKRGVAQVKPSRLALMRTPVAALGEIAEKVEEDTQRASDVLDIFMPFVAENAYVFRCDNSHTLVASVHDDERAQLGYRPNGFIWRDYWLNIHTPGLDQWVLPGLEEELSGGPKLPYMYRSLTELFESATHTHRHRIALRYLCDEGDEHLTYGDLRTLGFRVAGYLANQGVAHEDRVLLVSENRPEWVAAYFGIVLAGATVVPVDPNATLAEITNIAKASGARGIIVSPQGIQRLFPNDDADVDTLRQQLGTEVWMLNHAVCSRQSLDEAREPAQVASIIFTSGTTGQPKGVMLTQRNFTFEVSRLGGIFKLGVNDHMLSVLPLHHTFEFSAGLLTPLSRGGCITYLEEVTGDTLARALKDGVTGLIGVPALWQVLQRRIETQINDAGALPELVMRGMQSANVFLRDQIGLNIGPVATYPIHRALGGQLKYLVSGGSALGPEVSHFFRGLGFNLSQGYGLTETAPVLTVTDPTRKVLEGSVGQPISGVEIRIEQPNAEGVGEVTVRGPNVMAGYYGDKNATASVMTSDGWLRTGDLGHLNQSGELFLVGRIKDVIVDADGRNVYPDELEELYGAHACIKEISIFGFQEKKDQAVERVAALVVPDYEQSKQDAGHSDVLDAIHAHLKSVAEELPFHRRLKVIEIWDGVLPRTATRKVKRPEVAKIFKNMRNKRIKGERSQEKIAPSNRGDRLALVRQALHTLTGRDDCTEETAIADLGLDSLMFVELASALERHVAGDVTVDQLMGLSTVGDVLPLLRQVSPVAKKKNAPTQEPEGLWVPKPIAGFGKKLLARAQHHFYTRVMQTKIRGRAHIPVLSGFLAVANHTSHLDAGLVKIALGPHGRNLATLGARDYFFESKVRRTYFENFTNVVPIERHGAIQEGLRRAMAVLQRGQPLLLFPEGTRSQNGTMQEFKSSLGYLVLTTQVPVVPIYLRGTHEAMPKGAMLVPSARHIGATIGPSLTYDMLHGLTTNMTRADAYRFVTKLTYDAVRALQKNGGYHVADLVAAMDTQAHGHQTTPAHTPVAVPTTKGNMKKAVAHSAKIIEPHHSRPQQGGDI